MTAKVDFSNLGNRITFQCELGDMSEDSKRGLFNALLRDPDVMCGKTSEVERKEMFHLLDRACAWSAQDRKPYVTRESLIEAAKLGAEYAALYTGNGVERGYKFDKPMRDSNGDVDPELVTSYLRRIAKEAK